MKTAAFLTAFLAVTGLTVLHPAGEAAAAQQVEGAAGQTAAVKASEVVIVPDKEYNADPYIVAAGTIAVFTAAGAAVYRGRKGGKRRNNSKNNKINRNP